jgi:hypothetical protein
MPLDPTNPAVPDQPDPKINQEFLVEQRKLSAAAQQHAEAATLMAQTSSGKPITQGGVYLEILCAVLIGRLALNSSDAQIWADDLTADYLTKYNLNGTPKLQ